MPTYDYKCDKCGKIFELWQKITEAPMTSCPEKDCDGTVSRILGGGAGFLLKGNGFYATDYRSSDYTKKKQSESSSSGGTSSSATSKKDA